ncbi:IucC family-domain-containing protein [Phycomyces blakesleeanus]
MPVSLTMSKNLQYAKFATTSRLISCLVMETLVSAYYVPANTPQGTPICLLVRPNCSSTQETPSTIRLSDVLAVIPLRGVPILSTETGSCAVLNDIKCPRIDLIDPMDMLSHIYSIQGQEPSTLTISDDNLRNQVYDLLVSVCKPNIQLTAKKLIDAFDAVQLWKQFADDFGVDPKLTEEIGLELNSSIEHQNYAYDNPKSLPTLKSSSIHWEQSVLEGHATHPMHKARKSYPPMPPLIPGKVNLEQPQLRLVAVPVSSLKIRGDFEKLSAPIVNAILSKSEGKSADEMRAAYPNHIFIPIHELQVPNVESKFPEATVLPKENSVTIQSLTSLRSVAVPDILPGLSLKLCLGIKISSALRTITPFSTHFGPGFSYDVVPKLTYDPNVLTVERELSSAVHINADFDIAKHCSCVLREAVEFPVDAEQCPDKVVVCAALVEKIQRPDTDETLLTHVWKLDSEAKRIAFLDRYIDLALQAFLPPCLINGVAFEAHGQNTLARFDKETGELKGFVARDFGGIKVHRETLRKSAGVDIDVLPDSCVVADTLEEVYKLLYHTLIHSHLQRLIRVLDLHYNGVGWELLRKHMSQMIPRDHPMWKVFMETPKVPGKCLVRMKIEELYRDYIYCPVPNVIHYIPQNVEEIAVATA